MPKGQRTTREEFIERANNKYNNKYNYDKFIFINMRSKGIVICPFHQEFETTPSNHLKSECFDCAHKLIAQKRTYTLEEFLIRCKEIHGDIYDYSKFIYNGSDKKGIIICKIHSEFLQTPHCHLNAGHGCRKCTNEKLSQKYVSNKLEFVEKANKKHHHKYDYSKFIYVNVKTKGIIICNEITNGELHGEFTQTANQHLASVGCSKCGKEISRIKNTYNQEDIIEKFIITHGPTYDYSKFIYAGRSELGIIICHKKNEMGEEHGEFLKSPSTHLTGKVKGCPKCLPKRIHTLKYTIEEFIEKANLIHNNKYDYSKFEYTSCKQKSIIICPEHSEFLQSADVHLNHKSGCPKCKPRISKMERLWLDELNLPDDAEHRNVYIRINNKRYFVDGFDPVKNTIFEFWGSYWHGDPNIFPPNEINPNVKKTYGELYQETLNKINIFHEAGFKIVQIWESEYKKNKK